EAFFASCDKRVVLSSLQLRLQPPSSFPTAKAFGCPSLCSNLRPVHCGPAWGARLVPTPRYPPVTTVPAAAPFEKQTPNQGSCYKHGFRQRQRFSLWRAPALKENNKKGTLFT